MIKVFNLSPSCASDQRAAAVRAWSVGTLPVRHGARHVAQRGGAECHRKAGEPAVRFYLCLKGNGPQRRPVISGENAREDTVTKDLFYWVKETSSSCVVSSASSLMQLSHIRHKADKQ